MGVYLQATKPSRLKYEVGNARNDTDDRPRQPATSYTIELILLRLLPGWSNNGMSTKNSGRGMGY